VLDYIARWLGGRFISSDYLKLTGEQLAAAAAPTSSNSAMVESMLQAVANSSAGSGSASLKQTNAHEGAPACSECGMLMVPNGACYKCENCGSTSGCS
jgi:ribonucleoside-diphosphate reductase alpha chain